MRAWLEWLGLWVLRGLTYGLVALTLGVLGQVVWRGSSALSWTFLTAGHSEGGVGPAIAGTLALTLGTIALALPIGMGAAVYLTEYAPGRRTTEWIRVGILTLAGVPSIVFGLFGLALFVVGWGLGKSLLAGVLTLSLMILPVIVVASEEALRAVPRSVREASWALGATRWQTIWHHVLPYSFPGMLTGSILGIARAAGETAPILFTAAVALGPHWPGLFQPVMALPYQLYHLVSEDPRPEALGLSYATALVLIALVLGVNLVAIVLRDRARKTYRW